MIHSQVSPFRKQLSVWWKENMICLQIERKTRIHLSQEGNNKRVLIVVKTDPTPGNNNLRHSSDREENSPSSYSHLMGMSSKKIFPSISQQSSFGPQREFATRISTFFDSAHGKQGWFFRLGDRDLFDRTISEDSLRYKTSKIVDGCSTCSWECKNDSKEAKNGKKERDVSQRSTQKIRLAACLHLRDFIGDTSYEGG